MSTRLVATLNLSDDAVAAGALRDPPSGADYIELRLDTLPEASTARVTTLLGLPRSIPVIATCRPGGSAGDDAARLALLAAAGEAGADVLDVDDALLDSLPASVPGDRIASCHISRFVPRLESLARRVAGHGTRYAKLAVPANTPVQLAELLDLQDEARDGFAIVPTGRLSEAGRVMIAGRGAALGYGAVAAGHEGHPDQPTVARLHEVFNLGLVGPGTRFFAVAGTPLGHSLSPGWHNTVFRGVGLDARMVTLDVERLADVLAMADALRLDGMAVTHPHKHDALRLAASALPGAATTGAANTLMRTPAGWQARNTDWKAACDLLPRLLRGWRRKHKDQTPRVLLLGSGGAARALAVALYGEDIELAIWSRRLSNARDLVDSLVEVLPAHAVPEPGHFPADLLINATPVGMRGCDLGEMSMTASNFRVGALAVDLAYGAEESPFRDAATEAEAQMTSGEEFFCLQARRQSELFTGGPLPEGMRDEAARRCGAVS
jgi:3-dehydroquinate dehydratase/shikimate dehydrogenase